MPVPSNLRLIGISILNYQLVIGFLFASQPGRQTERERGVESTDDLLACFGLWHISFILRLLLCFVGFFVAPSFRLFLLFVCPITPFKLMTAGAKWKFALLLWLNNTRHGQTKMLPLVKVAFLSASGIFAACPLPPPARFALPLLFWGHTEMA